MKSLTILLCICFVFEANADILWPSMYVVLGMYSLWSIIGGFLAELVIIRYGLKQTWLESTWICCIINLTSFIIGWVLVLLGGLGLEFLMYPIDVIIGTNTFHWFHFVISYIFAILVNTQIESSIAQTFMEKIKYKKIFLCLFCANAISIIIAAIYVRVANVKL